MSSLILSDQGDKRWLVIKQINRQDGAPKKLPSLKKMTTEYWYSDVSGITGIWVFCIHIPTVLLYRKNVLPEVQLHVSPSGIVRVFSQDEFKHWLPLK